MNGNRPTVHPVEAPPLTEGPLNGPRMRMKEVEGMPGTHGGLSLRLAQFIFGLVSVCVMSSTSDFRSVTAFRYLVIAVCLQIFWSLSLAIIDVYALMVRRSLRKRIILRLFTIGDGITSTLTFAAACASAGITVLVGNDLNKCSVNHCAKFEAATAMAFISWFAMTPSFLMNFWSLATQ
ncbi:CASP-like protein 5A1 [Euphorbia lathyris]|uniref:CASP-like protein 5A1 n=1 Tax=Euphorbia lathyris TaxID=212925 RepID=UPI003313F0AF